MQVGVARVDITPAYPIRLSGYAARTTECEGVEQRISARALALGTDREGPIVLVSVEVTGLPGSVRDEVARRLQRRARIAPERLAICVTHTHAAPHVAGYLTNLFLGPLPADQQARIEQFSRELTDALEQVALAALKDRRAATLGLARTTCAFAANRRTPGGPVDHEVPVLVATDRRGRVRALLATYACHCTTLVSDFNRISGDWAGYAQEFLERDHPGAIALVTIGCAGDANPAPRPGLENARRHGQALATAVNEILRAPRTPVSGPVQCRMQVIPLAFEALPTRAEWEARVRDPKASPYVIQHARGNLARLDRGDTLPTTLPYRIQTWAFGQDLGMVFLAGEVVVDYSLRLKQELDRSRLWIHAYANDVPCYIPSERVLREGGYEPETSMIYYDQPARLAPGLEDRIVAAVRELLPPTFQR